MPIIPEPGLGLFVSHSTYSLICISCLVHVGIRVIPGLSTLCLSFLTYRISNDLSS